MLIPIIVEVTAPLIPIAFPIIIFTLTLRPLEPFPRLKLLDDDPLLGSVEVTEVAKA